MENVEPYMKEYPDPQNKPQSKAAKFWKELLIMIVGCTICSLGVYFFKMPNNFATGGVMGFAIVLHAVWPVLNTSIINLIINSGLLLVALIIVGRNFGIKTIFCTLLFSGEIALAEWLIPLAAPVTRYPLMDLIFATLCHGLGSAMLFEVNASSGGTDIVAMVIKKKTSLNISSALFVADLAIVIADTVVFRVLEGSFETGLFSLLGFLANVFVVDKFLDRINLAKYCTVITKPEYTDEILHYITKILHKGATVGNDFEGGYTKEKRSVIFCALTTKQAVGLKRFVKALDKSNFVIVTNTSDITGKGFRESI